MVRFPKTNPPPPIPTVMVKSLELLLCIWRFWTQILAQRPDALLNKPYVKIVNTPQIIEPVRMKSKALVAGGTHMDLDF
jgi:hypothetical protein